MLPLVAVAAVTAATKLVGSILGNNAAVKQWEQQVKTAHANTVNQQTEVKSELRGANEKFALQRRGLKIASMEEQGRQRAATAGTGVTGQYAERQIQNTANKAGRALMQNTLNREGYNQRVQVNINNMWSNYQNQAKANVPKMDWGSALTQSAMAGLSAYASGGGFAGGVAATTAQVGGTSPTMNAVTSYMPWSNHMTPTDVNRLVNSMGATHG